MREEILYVWLQQAIGICSKAGRELFTRFGSIDEIYECRDFSFLTGNRNGLIRQLESKDTSASFEVLKKCQRAGIRITGYYDEDYPERLRLISAPPAVLYSIGIWHNLNRVPCIAVVGTRKATDYGCEIAESFAYNFSKSGAIVVSGLARGADTAAHRGAVRAGGYTVGVLGNPIGEIYPKENEKAFRTLYERGLVISEMYPGCERTRADFPNRNRIISGLCDVTVVAEAGEHSGSLITARHAISQGRTVYAVPGAIGAANAGTNELIKNGVAAATTPFDVIAPLSLEYPDKIHPYEPSLTHRLRSYGNGSVKPEAAGKPVPAENMPEKSVPKGDAGAVIACLAGKSLTSDEIARETGMDISAVLSELTVLEIEEKVVPSAGGRYSLPRK